MKRHLLSLLKSTSIFVAGKTMFRNKINLISRKGLLAFALIFSSLFFAELKAQQIDWELNYPKLNKGMLTVGLDVDSILIKFTPSSNVLIGKVVVVLPKFYNLTAASSYAKVSSGHTTACTFASTSSVTSSITTCTITFNGTGGTTLIAGKKVSIAIPIKAICSALTNDVASIKVQTNATVLSTQTLNLQSQTSIVRLTTDNPSIAYSSIADTKEVSLSMDAVNGDNTTFSAALRVDKYTTLSNFKLNGNPLTAARVKTLSSTDTIHTISFTSASLVNGKADATPQILTFDASSTRCNTHTILSSTKNSCGTVSNGATITLSYNPIVGLPNMSYVSVKYLAADRITPIANTFNLPKDLSTVYYINFVYKNTGAVDAYEVLANVGLYGSLYGYFDATSIKYQIDGGADKSVTAAMITSSNKLPSSSYIKAPYVNKFYRATLALPEAIPVGSTVSFFIPCRAGNTHDFGTSNAIQAINNRGTLGYYSYLSCKNQCTDAGVAGSKESYEIDPVFRAVPLFKVLTPNQSYTEEVALNTGRKFSSAAADYNELKFFVEFPDWISLEDLPSNSFYLQNSAGVLYTPRALSIKDLSTTGTKKYTVSYFTGNADANAKLILKYKTGACPYVTSNPNGKIHFWMDHQLGDTVSTNPPLLNVSQVFKDVQFTCKKDGIQLDKFSFVRTTRGATDLDNNGTPDASGGIAAEADVRNNLYLTDNIDEGKIKWNATVQGSVGETFKYLYLPITLTGGLLTTHLTPDLINGTISINGGPLKSVQCFTPATSKFYVYLDATAAPLNVGDVIEVLLPFKAKAARELFDFIKTEGFLSNVTIADPFNTVGNTDKRGDDILVSTIGLFSTLKTFTASSSTYNDNLLKTNVLINSIYNYNTTNLGSPYFSKEVRRVWYPISLELDYPDGYSKSNLKVFYESGMDAINPAAANNTKYITNPTKSGITYSYDLGSLFDPSFDGTNALSSGKWQLPDDRFVMRAYLDVQASKQAPVGTTGWNTRLVWKNIKTGATVKTGNAVAYYTYNGPTVKLNLSASNINAYSDSLNIPIATIMNPSTQGLNNVWLYLDGNVKDVFLSDVGTNTPVKISGTGFEGRWIPISTLYPAGSNNLYQLNFTYKGAASCTPLDTIKVYTVSGFNDAVWLPNTSAAIDLSQTNYLGPVRKVTVTSPGAVIGGAISVDNTKLDYDVLYNLTASVNSKAGEGALKNPQITFTIPAGQKYEENSAKIDYPLGTKTALAPSVEAALSALNSNLTSDRTFVFSLKDALGKSGNFLMPGYLGTNANPQNQEAILTASFKPECNSNLIGSRFKGTFDGTSACGNAAKNSGTIILAEKMNADNVGSYSFTVNTSINSGNRAFNEYRSTDQLNIAIKKASRLNDSIASTDLVQIELPACVDISGTAMFSGAISETGSIISNTVLADVRTIKIAVPSAKLNALVVKDALFNLNIPISYTANAQAWAATPVNTIEVNMITGAAFGPCTNKEFSIGQGTVDIAILTNSNEQYKACLNMPLGLKVTSTGFTGNWYSDAAGATFLKAGTDYTYTPTVQATKTVYASCIFGGINYGLVPVQVKMHPQTIAKFSSSATTVCEGTTITFTDLSTINGVPADASNTTAWTWDDNTYATLLATSQNTSASFTQNGVHEIIQTIVSNDGCIDSDTINITNNKTPTVTVMDGYFCAPGQVNYNAASDVATANFEWFDNANVSLATTANLTTITLNASTHFYVQASNNACTMGKILVNAFAYPTTSIWKGSVSTDWLDNANWSNGIPGECTDIVIEQNSSLRYPDLTSLPTDAECNLIVFEPGSSIFGLDRLAYDSAKVMIDLKRDKWYMLTSPLKEMYSGDYYFEGAPVSDMKLFGYNTTASAGTNVATTTSNWTNSFASLTEKLTPGEGFAYRVQSTEWNYPSGTKTVTGDTTITFPRVNTDGSLKKTAIPYSAVTGRLYPSMAQTMTKVDNVAYRFAMENGSNKLTDIIIPVKAGLNLIGNPLMSYLDFVELQKDANNVSLISPFVQFWNGNTFESITTGGVMSGSAVDGKSLQIPPMKSFVVNALANGNLIIRLSHFTPSGSVALKGAKIKENTLYIESNNGLAKSSTSLIMNPNATNTNDKEDVSKLYTQLSQVPEVYTIAGKKAMDINQFRSFPYIVPVGVKSGGSDSIKLNFKGVESFEGVEVKLINTATNESQDLKENCTYCFATNGANSEGSLFLEFRSAGTTTANDLSNTNSGIQIFTAKDNSVKVLSSVENKALEIFVYDPLGKLVTHKTALSNTSESVAINHPGKVFVVKVISEKGVEVKKVVMD